MFLRSGSGDTDVSSELKTTTKNTTVSDEQLEAKQDRKLTRMFLQIGVTLIKVSVSFFSRLKKSTLRIPKELTEIGWG